MFHWRKDSLRMRMRTMKHSMKNQNRSGWLRLMAAALALCVTGYVLPGLTLNAQAAETGSALHFAEHGIKAYEEGWLYAGGGKGETVAGKRQSDCAGLLYAYFTDNKMTAPAGGATSQVTYNCAFSGDLDELDGIPRIHGLTVTAPDYYDPGTGIYGHVGIYIGNGEAVDNSTYGVNMRRQAIAENSSWNAWHVFDNGLRYPTNGWYSMNGAMYHYTDYQYDIDTWVDGYYISSDGVAREENGDPIPVDNSMPNDGYASASAVAEYLAGLGYSGKDSTRELIYSGGSDDPDPDPEYNGKITGDGVRLRAEPNTNSSIVTSMYRGTKVKILDEVEGQSISNSGQASTKWYQIVTSSGKEGYVSAWYAEYVSQGNGGAATGLKAPSITVNGGTVVLSTPTTDGTIYFTTDGTQPSEANGLIYTGPELTMGCTYRAVTVRDGETSSVTTATVTSNGVLLTDVTDKDWYFSAVEETVRQGIFNGSGTNAFDPNGLMTRAMLMTVLARFDGVDTSGEPWYAKGLEWAVNSGVSDGSSPNGKITREQLVTMLYRYAGAQPGSAETLNGFADSGSVSGYALDAVRWAAENKIIQGKEGNRVEPKAEATRAEVAVMMQRFLRLVG